MIENQLSASLDRRAGTFLAAAQFAADAQHVRTAAIVGASATVARSHGLAGVEGYLAALNDLGTTDDGLAGARSGRPSTRQSWLSRPRHGWVACRHLSETRRRTIWRARSVALPETEVRAASSVVQIGTEFGPESHLRSLLEGRLGPNSASWGGGGLPRAPYSGNRFRIGRLTI